VDRPTTDSIHIEQLEVFARVGVTDAERAQPQRVTLTITLWPKQEFEDLQDNIALSVDYSAVCAAMREMVRKSSNKLIETLATQLATHLLETFPIERAQIEVRKFVVADAKHVSVRVTRSAAAGLK
jgi:FolB domain-containing protein